MTEWAATALDRLRERYGAAADPQRAVPMAAYMRGQFPFLGIPSPAQRVLSRQVLAALPRPGEEDLRVVALGCWDLAEREYQYFACGLLRRHARVCGPGFIDTARYLLVTKSWWDTVDTLAAHLVGPLVTRHPALVSTMDTWAARGTGAATGAGATMGTGATGSSSAAGSDLWLARTAVLHQLTYKEDTDPARLFRYCTALAGHPDFFIRKAIGWALREYAKTDPAAVRGYVQAHQATLSPLSVREALRHM